MRTLLSTWCGSRRRFQRTFLEGRKAVAWLGIALMALQIVGTGALTPRALARQTASLGIEAVSICSSTGETSALDGKSSPSRRADHGGCCVLCLPINAGTALAPGGSPVPAPGIASFIQTAWAPDPVPPLSTRLLGGPSPRAPPLA